MKFVVVALFFTAANAAHIRRKSFPVDSAIFDLREVRHIPSPPAPFDHGPLRDLIDTSSLYLEQYLEELASYLELLVEQGQHVTQGVLEQLSTLIDDLQHLGVEHWQAGVSHLLEHYSPLLEGLFGLLDDDHQQTAAWVAKGFDLETAVNSILEMLASNESVQDILGFLDQLPATLQQLFEQLFGGLTFQEIGQLLAGVLGRRQSDSAVWELVQARISEDRTCRLQNLLQWLQAVWDAAILSATPVLERLLQSSHQLVREAGKARVDVAYRVFRELGPFADYLSRPWREVVGAARRVMLRH